MPKISRRIGGGCGLRLQFSLGLGSSQRRTTGFVSHEIELVGAFKRFFALSQAGTADGAWPITPGPGLNHGNGIGRSVGYDWDGRVTAIAGSLSPQSLSHRQSNQMKR